MSRPHFDSPRAPLIHAGGHFELTLVATDSRGAAIELSVRVVWLGVGYVCGVRGVQLGEGRVVLRS
jgi:hypothetical protein